MKSHKNVHDNNDSAGEGGDEANIVYDIQHVDKTTLQRLNIIGNMLLMLKTDQGLNYSTHT